MMRFLSFILISLMVAGFSGCESTTIPPDVEPAEFGAEPLPETSYTTSTGVECDCEAGEKVLINSYTVPEIGGYWDCKVWNECQTVSVCSNMPPDPSLAGLFGFFKIVEECEWIRVVPPLVPAPNPFN